MQSRTFDRTLRSFSRRVPFRPFTVELVGGSRFTVTHPKALVFHAGTAVYFVPNSDLTIFDHEGVNRLSDADGQRSRPR